MSPQNIASAEMDLSSFAGLVAAAQAAGQPITGDEVEFHDGPKISLPKGMTYPKAYDVLQRLEKESEQETQFVRMFRYRPDDGGYATFMSIKNRWGMLLGKTIHTMFGSIKPQIRTINVGVNQTLQVPWGNIQIPHMPGLTIMIGEAQDKDYGTIFGLRAEGPRKYKEEVEGFFDDVEQYLKTNSIYRGHAISGSNDPQFLDLSAFDAKKIVFSQQVMRALEGDLWAPIRYTKTMRKEKLPLKRSTLLYGPYGTGKTSIGQMTAQVATDNGWTFFSARPGRDKAEDVLRTARLYQPAVVFIEDIDTESSSADSDDVTKLLEAFDGITSKGGEIIVAMTTNHIDRIHKGMLRPGRLDAIIEIDKLDRAGVETLVKNIVSPDKLAGDVDYDAVFEAMEGYLPAFVKESLTRAVTYSISRAEGGAGYMINTSDIVDAAHSLRPQYERLNAADEGQKPDSLSQAMRAEVKTAVKDLVVFDYENDTWGAIEDKKQAVEDGDHSVYPTSHRN
jgi:transitional endoplasmic reticulum ATPase